MTPTTQNILLGVTGGIAAYKSAEIIRRLRERGFIVRVVMTGSAEKFIGQITLQALSGSPVYTNLFESEYRAMEHIDLARWADKILIAPATADFIAKLANGNANDLLSTVCLAADCPIYLAPAMNHLMWSNIATQNNVNLLSARDYQILDPGTGDQACGETGAGRLMDVERIVQAMQNHEKSLDKLNVLITAGPTREAIDPVRFISNHSSGKMGYALAKRAIMAGANVTLVSGPVNLARPSGCKTLQIESAEQMMTAVSSELSQVHLFISAAAVADYRPAALANQKIKKSHASMQIQLLKNPDILAEVARHNIFCVGFSAETENLIENAKLKLVQKNLDMIIANQVGKDEHGNYQGFHSDRNTLTAITKNTQIELPENTKDLLAKELIQIIAKAYTKSQQCSHLSAKNEV